MFYKYVGLSMVMIAPPSVTLELILGASERESPCERQEKISGDGGGILVNSVGGIT